MPAVYLVGQTHVHLDEVEGLGDFVELEVVLRGKQGACNGVESAQALMGKLGISQTQFIDKAYVDLLG